MRNLLHLFVLSFLIVCSVAFSSYGQSNHQFEVNGYSFSLWAESFNMDESGPLPIVSFTTCSDFFRYEDGPGSISVYTMGSSNNLLQGSKMPAFSDAVHVFDQNGIELFSYHNMAQIRKLQAIDFKPLSNGGSPVVQQSQDTLFRCIGPYSSTTALMIKLSFNTYFNSSVYEWSRPLSEYQFYTGSFPYAHYLVNGTKRSEIGEFGFEIGDTTVMVVPDGAILAEGMVFPEVPVPEVMPLICYINNTGQTITSPLKIVKETERIVYPTFPKDTVAICPFDSVLVEFPWKKINNRYSVSGKSYSSYRNPIYAKNPGSYRVYWINKHGCWLPSAPLTLVHKTEDCIYTQVTGIVFHDLNGNGRQDAGDLPLAGRVVKDATGKFTAISDSDGKYILNLEPGKSYSVNVAVNEPHTATTESIELTASSSEYFILENAHLGVSIPAEIDVEISLNAGFFRPGFEVPFYVHLSNTGSLAASGEVTVDFPAEFEVLSTSGSGIINGNSLVYDFSDVHYAAKDSFIIRTRLSASSALGISLTVNANADVTESEVNSINTSYAYSGIVTGSFDPNDKQVKSEEGSIVKSDYLEYTIRFQNTGTDTAFAVVVTDTISDMHDFGSFEMLAASHEYRVELNKGIAKWTFMNILLPDSNRNEPASHGFVKFRIKLNEDVLPGEIARNKAYIFFDYNEAIITNEASVQIVDPVLSNIDPEMVNKLLAYPVPSSGTVAVPLQGADRILIFNSAGQAVMDKNTRDNVLMLNLKDYPKGLYQYQLLKENEMIYSSKIILY